MKGNKITMKTYRKLKRKEKGRINRSKEIKQ
jgi:hypothetical protein